MFRQIIFRGFLMGLVTLPALLLSSSTAHAQNLVANPGFETGDFTSWTVIPAAVSSQVAVDSFIVHTGDFSASFGADGFQDDTITQVIPTAPNRTYLLSFWLLNDAVGQDHFAASVNGTPVFDIGPTSSSFGFTEETFTFIASNAPTLLSFSSFDRVRAFHLDDVSVINQNVAPEPGTLALLGMVALPLVGMLCRRKA